MDHFRMNLDFVNELHVISQLLKIPDVAITNLTNDEVVFGTAGG